MLFINKYVAIIHFYVFQNVAISEKMKFTSEELNIPSGSGLNVKALFNNSTFCT